MVTDIRMLKFRIVELLDMFGQGHLICFVVYIQLGSWLQSTGETALPHGGDRSSRRRRLYDIDCSFIKSEDFLIVV